MSLLTELNRRNVFRVAVFYVVVTWLLLQVTDVMTPILLLPDWVGRVVFFLLALGFIPTLVFSWIYEITPEGVKKEAEIERDESITHVTGKRLDIMTIIVVILAVGIVFLRPSPEPLETPAESTSIPQQAAVEQEEDRKSIAVLPFDNFSDDADNAFFASGVHEDILTHLAKIRDLRVISRTSVEQYSENRPPMGQIAADLGVRNIVEGSVRRAGNRVRVTAQLIDASTDEHLWAESFDRDLTDVFAIQTEIARQIAAALEATLSTDEEALIAERPTENMAAYDLYLRAREILRRSDYSIQKYRDAEPLLMSAIELDPTFALAHALLVEIHGQTVWLASDTSDYRKNAALQAAERALELAPRSPEALAAMGEYHYRILSDFPAAAADFEAARDQLPNDSQIWFRLGMTYRRLGRWEESIEALEQAVDLDPANLSLVFGLADTLNLTGDWDRIMQLADPILRENPEDSGMATIKAWALVSGNGNVEAARALLDSVPKVNSPQYIFLRIFTAQARRDFDDVLTMLEEPETISAMGGEGWGGIINQIAGDAWAGKGDEIRAREEYQRARAAAQSTLSREGVDANIRLFVRSTLARVLVELGEFDEALQVSESIFNEPSNAVDEPGARASHAWVLARLGRVDEAMDILADVLDQPGGGPNRWGLTLDPSWDFLRDTERFQELTRVEKKIGVSP